MKRNRQAVTVVLLSMTIVSAIGYMLVQLTGRPSLLPLQSPILVPTVRGTELPIPTPPATAFIRPTPVIVATRSEPTSVNTPTPYPPPPGWSTDQPWPPVTITPTFAITTTSIAFPTPIIQYSEEQTDSPQKIWYLAYPNPGAILRLTELQVDADGRTIRDTLTEIILPIQGNHVAHPVAVEGVHISPNGQYAILDIPFRGSWVVDLSDNSLRQIADKTPAQFLTWHPDGIQALVLTDTLNALAMVDVSTGFIRAMRVSEIDQYGKVAAGAYSPDGKYLALLVLYPPVREVREAWSLEVIVYDPSNGRSILVKEIPGISAALGLEWSFDSQSVIWSATSVKDNSADITSSISEIWMASLANSTTRPLWLAAEGVEYRHPPIWVNRFEIAALKVEESRDGKEAGTNIYLIDASSGDVMQVTRYRSAKLSELARSPNMQWIAFTRSFMMGEFDWGEVWAVNLAGTHQYSLAGPTVSNAPFAWLR